MPFQIPLYTLEGVPNADVSTHYLATEDKLGLSMLRFKRAPTQDIVLIIHGLTTSSDMFIMPEHNNLVRYLLDHGYGDVWCLDYRMSNRHPYNLLAKHYSMDDIALYDFPPALAKIREQVPGARIHVICHCLGAVSFLMSLFGGASTDVASVIANSVGLTPRVPAWSRFKLFAAPLLVERILGLPYLNPAWSEDAILSRGRVISAINSLVHRECDVPACHMLSLMWGTGMPALYNHHNLADVTHRRGGDLYGAAGLHYYRHVRKMVVAGRAVKFNPKDDRHSSLPNDYFERARDVKTPVLFVTGTDNRVFTDSNVVCFKELEKLCPGRHKLEMISDYGHQDVFMGKDCDRDVFPRFVAYLDQQRSSSADVSSGASSGERSAVRNNGESAARAS
jgi:lysosomal acid lipase/cholesteryl ester hydrolase